MDSYPGDFPFGIMDVVELLHLRIRRRQANSVYVDCPFCGDRRGKMNVNFVKNVWRCNYCDEHGGMLALYARLNNTTTSDAYWEIGEALCNDFHRERPNSGYYYRDEKKEVLDMAFDKLVEWPAGCVQTMDAKDAHAFFELCGELVESEPRPRHEILNMVLTMIGGEAA